MSHKKIAGNDKEKIYIAHQAYHPKNFDEMNELVTGYMYQQNVMLVFYGYFNYYEGIHPIIETFANLIDKEIEYIISNSEVEINDLVGKRIISPLTDNKGQEIKYEEKRIPGPLTEAMRDGKIFYAGRLNLLSDKVQAYLCDPLYFRSNLKDEQGEVWVYKASNEFMFIASVYPDLNFENREVYGKLKDRFTWVPIKEPNIDLQTRIFLLRADIFSLKDIIDDKIQIRGVHKNKFEFYIKEEGKFLNMLNGKILPKEEENEIRKYLCYIGGVDSKLSIENKDKKEIYENSYEIVRFLRDICNLILKGTKGAPDYVQVILKKMNIPPFDCLPHFSDVPLWYSRIIISTLKDYTYYLNEKLEPERLRNSLINGLVKRIVVDKGEFEIASGITWEHLIREIGSCFKMKINEQEYSFFEE